jgi:hypothetical protein
MPPNTVKVSRPGKWGNPFKVGELTFVWHRPGSAPGWPDEPVYRDGFRVQRADHAVRLFRMAMECRPDWYHEKWQAPDVSELRGKNLACWCPLDAPCHADVLLELANRDASTIQEPPC